MCGYWIVSDYHKALAQRQQLDGQLNENTAVKQVCGNLHVRVIFEKLMLGQLGKCLHETLCS